MFGTSLHENYLHLKLQSHVFFKCCLSLFFIFRESALAAKHSCEVLKDKPIERVQRSNNTKEMTPTSKVIDYFDFSTQWAVPLNWKSLHLLFRECFISCMIAYVIPLVWCLIFFFQFCDKRVFFFIIRKLNTLAQESLSARGQKSAIWISMHY